MRITRVWTTRLRYRREVPMADALNDIPERRAVLVFVETDEGLVGIGESAYFGGPPQVTQAIIEQELAGLIVGQPALEVERLWHRMFHRSMQHGRRGAVVAAMGGVDIALWDLLGKATDQPVHRLLGTFRTRFPAYASGGFYLPGNPLDALVEEMRSHVSRGFRAVKMKVGRNPEIAMNPLSTMFDGDVGGLTVEEDLARVRAVREAIGPDCRLMVDANSGWNVNVALRALPELAELGVEWLEEPLFAEDVAGNARLVDTGLVPIAGYEVLQGRYAFRDFLAAGAVDIVQPDATWSGGITECRRIAALASAQHKACAPHVFGSAVGLAANAHLLASLPNGLVLELDQTPNALRDELVTTPMTLDADGTVALPDGPGLGITLDEDAVARYLDSP
jgi:L-alanine-DL-glutamate epimerase-like enolase superfamily enzyme